MMLLGTADVTGRYIFNKPILGTAEIFGILLPAIVLLGLAYTQEAQAHAQGVCPNYLLYVIHSYWGVNI